MKSRRDITLGEMQDECKKRLRVCAPDVEGNNECKYVGTCNQMRSKACIPPDGWDLTDPPRFNEQQMALLKVFYNRGFRKVITGSTSDALIDCIREFLGVGQDVTLDLAELIGKDGAK